jgi:hypothetical protein
MNVGRMLERMGGFLSPEGEGGGGGGSTIAPPPNGGPGPGGPPPAAVLPPAGTPPPQGGGGGGADDFETRFQARIRQEGWMPAHRGTEMSQRARTLQQALEQERQRVRALTGVEAPPNPQVVEVQQAIEQMFPFLKTAREKQAHIDRLLQLVEGGDLDTLMQARDMTFQRGAFTAASAASKGWAEATGRAESDLTPRDRQRLGQALRAFIGEDETGQRASRYEFGDPGLIDEFVKDYLGLFGPPRQQGNPGDGGQPGGGGQPGAGGGGNPVVEAARRAGALPRTGPRGVPPQHQEQRMDRKAVGAAARKAALERLGS